MQRRQYHIGAVHRRAVQKAHAVRLRIRVIGLRLRLELVHDLISDRVEAQPHLPLVGAYHVHVPACGGFKAGPGAAKVDGAREG
jgi:hypothetical protein